MTEGPRSVDEWMRAGAAAPDTADGRFTTMMARVARFHAKHAFADNNGHDMGYRLALTMEELGEFSATITKGMGAAAQAEELADVLILLLGHALALEIDLEGAFHAKLDEVMQRPARTGSLGVRVTRWSPPEAGSDECA